MFVLEPGAGPRLPVLYSIVWCFRYTGESGARAARWTEGKRWRGGGALIRRKISLPCSSVPVFHITNTSDLHINCRHSYSQNIYNRGVSLLVLLITDICRIAL